MPAFRNLRLLLVTASAMTLLLAGCGEEPRPPGDPYLHVNTPDGLLTDFQTAWKRKEVDHYAALLSDDFHFYFDPDTRASKGLPEFWDRSADTAAVGRVFASEEVSDIRIKLTYVKTPVADPHPGWDLVFVTNEQLEVDLAPHPGEQEGVTILVEGQIQDFHFRKGRTPADTLAISPTSKQYYIVEWRDRAKPGFGAGGLAAVEPSTWSSVKVLFR